MKLISTQEYLLLIDEEAEIKSDMWSHIDIDEFFYNKNRKEAVKLQAKEVGYDPGGYLIIGWYPLTKEAKELDLPLLPLKGLWTEEGEILEDDGIFVYLQDGKKYKKSELELWVENT